MSVICFYMRSYGMISYDYYRIFYYVAQYKSFTKAAQMLDNNQPNITRCMNNLESEIGCKLLYVPTEEYLLLLKDRGFMNTLLPDVSSLPLVSVSLPRIRGLNVDLLISVQVKLHCALYFLISLKHFTKHIHT